ncbi:MAG: translation initiation factor 2 [Lachnospiraceae bacterium]|nr:translation initiation factor 2 [Lachnospiraceae bacterium]MCM1240979.1 translation initiation factor 2 [Lachnospiraceae bacterium]
MTKKQEQWMVSELMDNLKMRDDQERSARRYVGRAVDKILIYCNRGDLPDQLMNTAVQIAEDMLRADQAVESGKEVASVDRGDTAISYRDSSAKAQLTVDFMKDHQKTLNHFKKMSLPGDKRND